MPGVWGGVKSQVVARASRTLLFVLVVLRDLLTHVAEVGMWVEFGGKSLFAAAPAGQKFSLFGVAPFHATVLEPDFHLDREQKD